MAKKFSELRAGRATRSANSKPAELAFLSTKITSKGSRIPNLFDPPGKAHPYGHKMNRQSFAYSCNTANKQQIN